MKYFLSIEREGWFCHEKCPFLHENGLDGFAECLFFKRALKSSMEKITTGVVAGQEYFEYETKFVACDECDEIASKLHKFELSS